MISAARIQAHDRRRSALHEAGHVVMAWRYGLDAQAIIKPLIDRDPDTDKSWTGRTGHRNIWRVSNTARVHIAVAGAIAENRPGDYDLVNEWEYWDEQPDAMSPSDWQLARYVPGKPDRRFMRAVEHAAEYLTAERPALLRVARALIVSAHHAPRVSVVALPSWAA
jgi:hypothetical protein